DDHGDLAADQIGGETRKAVIDVVGPAVLDRDILALDETGLLESLPERRCHHRVAVGGGAVQEPDHRHRRVLRERSERPRHDSTCKEESGEIAPPHSITSSASASSVAGKVRPNALAVFKLITRSNLLGSTTGSSPTLSPRRMRPA